MNGRVGAGKSASTEFLVCNPPNQKYVQSAQNVVKYKARCGLKKPSDLIVRELLG